MRWGLAGWKGRVRSPTPPPLSGHNVESVARDGPRLDVGIDRSYCGRRHLGSRVSWMQGGDALQTAFEGRRVGETGRLLTFNLRESVQRKDVDRCRSLLHQHPPVDDQQLACDVAGIVRSKEYGGAGQIVHLAHTPERNVLAAELFDIVIRMDGLGTFADEIKNCVEISLGRQKLKVLSLERILASKIAANRPKDKLTIPVLRDALAATQSVQRRVKKK